MIFELKLMLGFLSVLVFSLVLGYFIDKWLKRDEEEEVYSERVRSHVEKDETYYGNALKQPKEPSKTKYVTQKDRLTK